MRARSERDQRVANACEIGTVLLMNEAVVLPLSPKVRSAPTTKALDTKRLGRRVFLCAPDLSPHLMVA